MSSSMLEQAIIDAKELKESAQKNAEEAIVEKYQLEIKEAVEKILEQEDALGLGGDLGGGLGGDLAGAPGGKPESANQPESGKDQIDMVLEQLPFLQTTDDNEVIELDLGKLEESLNIVNEENLKDELQALSEIELDEDLLDEYMLEEDEEEGEKQDISMNDPEVAAALDDQIPIDEDLLEEYMLDEEIELDEEMLDELELNPNQIEMLAQKELADLTKQNVAEDLSLEEMIAEALEEMLGEEYILEQEEEEEEEEEEGMPDFPDVDEDGNKDEPITKAQKDKKEKEKKEGGESKKDYSKVPPQLRKHMQKKQKKQVAESKLLQRENKTLIKEQTRMSSKVQLLENKLDKYGTVIDQLKQKLDESNLASAKLLYQNRVLDSDSLNERQKDRIVEAIKDAGTVEEAKIIFETLQSTVDTTRKSGRKKESLDEVVYRGSSAFMPLKEAKQKVSDPFVARMQALAGLK